MKKTICLLIMFVCMFGLVGCNRKMEKDMTEQTLEAEIPAISETATVSGSFTVCVRDVIPDYCFDYTTPNVAVVTEFQNYPFTIFVGEEIGRQLKNGEVYVFTIEPVVVEYSKEYLKSLYLSSLVWELPGLKIVDFRLADEDEIGLDSLRLTIE